MLALPAGLSAVLAAIPWKLIVAIGAVLAIVQLWWRLNLVAAERDAATGRLADFAHAAQRSADTVKELQAQQAKALAAVDRVNEVATIRTAKLVTVKEEIANEPVSSSCGPAVHRALDALRLQQ